MIILPANTLSGGFEVANSCRFDGSNDYMSKTPGSNGDAQKFTTSVWFKRGVLNGDIRWLEMGNTILYSGSNIIGFGASSVDVYTESNYLMDFSAWYNLIVAVDTTQGTEANRVKIYLNGTQVTSSNGLHSSTSYPSLNQNLQCNQTEIHRVGARADNAGSKFDGYMAEFVHIDGSQLAPTSFGEFDEDSPRIWKPIDVSGLSSSKGTNGFYLDFEDSSNLGNDVWGGTDFTETGIAAVNQSSDSPTNNFATMNPIGNTHEQNANFTEGNLNIAGNDSSNAGFINSTIAPSQGKWYMEFKALDIQGTSYPGVGMISTQDATNNGQVGGATNSVSYRAGGTVLTNGSVTDTESSYTDNDIIGVAMDLDNGAVYFSKAGVWQNSGDPTSGSSKTGSLYSFTVSDSYHFATTVYQSTSIVSANFGNPEFSISSGNADGNGYGNFEYAVPSGYYSLCTKNLAEFG